MRALTRIATEADVGRLALIGDRRQLRTVEAGQPGPISLPLDRVGVARAYRLLNSGARFSMNAFSPSAKSSVAAQRAKLSFSRLS